MRDCHELITTVTLQRLKRHGLGLFQRRLAIGLIATVSTGLGWIVSQVPGIDAWVQTIDGAFYDAVYRLRSPEQVTDSPVVILEIDDRSLKQVADATTFSWPWPRGYYGLAARKLEEKGARVVVLDLILSERSAEGEEDDLAMAGFLDGLTRTRFVGAVVGSGRFVPPVTRPVRLADVQVDPTGTYREYTPRTPFGDSLALAAIKESGLKTRLEVDRPFRLRYYGPHRDETGRAPFPVYSIGTLINEIAFEQAGIPLPVEKRVPETLIRDKIVLVGAVAAGLMDLKNTPVSDRYPGVEVHATAILNLLKGHRVIPVEGWIRFLVIWLGSLGIVWGVVGWKPVWSKLLITSGVISVGLGVSAILMQLQTMKWFAPTVPVSAWVLSSLGAWGWVYRVEDARARVLLKILHQCISPAVANQLSSDPNLLTVGGQRREVTLLFSDMQGFTDLTERLGERIEPVLNHYLSEMSHQVLLRDGTIDKYIGDALMVFWGAPLVQSDHAIRACHTALSMIRQEQQMRETLVQLGCERCRTRIGIHTGEVIVGFFGSQERLSYTAVGDSVNLAARLEPLNKQYGTQILVSSSTRQACGKDLIFRPVDRVRVYGKQQAVDVYELMSDTESMTNELLWKQRQSESAWQAYQQRDWKSCEKICLEILQRFSTDGPSRIWMDRAKRYQQQPPHADWDGVWELAEK